MSEHEPERMVLPPEWKTDWMKPLSMEVEFHDVDPAVLGILTGGVLGNKPDPTFAVEVTYPIKRTFWQWLTRKPRQWGHVYIPHATIETGEADGGA